jgi:hypothetical protein
MLKYKDYIKIKESVEEHDAESFEADIMENWEEYYEKSHGDEIPYGKYGVATIMAEAWSAICVAHIMEDPDDDCESYIEDEIANIINDENWDGYVWIDSYESGEEYGISVFYRYS